MKKIIFLLTVLMCTTVVEAKEEPEELYAQSAVLMDADSGRVLFEKNGTQQKAMASTTKIMTCILALENMDGEESVYFSENAVRQPKVHLGAGLQEGFYLSDLLYSLMLESHNDSAVAIAEAVAGSVTRFADMMNDKAKEIGCVNTYYITPNGLDATDEAGDHSTTAEDLARIMSYCVLKSPEKEEFLKITRTGAHTFFNLDKTRQYSCNNHNLFLGMSKDALSGKTGYTSEAGYCYVGAIQRGDRTFTVALLACGWPNHKNYKWLDMKKLTEYAFENYEFETVEAKPEIEEILVEKGKAEGIQLYENIKVMPVLDNDSEIRVLKKREENIRVVVVQERKLEAPINKGDCVGSAIYYLQNQRIKEVPLIIKIDIEKIDFEWIFLRVLERYMTL